MNDVFDMPFRLRSTGDRDVPVWLLDAETRQLVSRHPSIKSACIEARRIAAYRSMRKLEAQALLIVPVGGAQ